MNETALTASVRKNLRTVKGCWVYKTKGGEGTRAGVPDLLICYAGRFVGVEVKVPGNHTTELQNGELRDISVAGGMTVVAYGLGDVLKVLEAIKPIERLTIVKR